MIRSGYLVLFAVLGPVGNAAADDEQGFLNRMAGDWVGGGPVVRNAQSPVFNAKCSIAGNHSGNSMSIDGVCRGAVIVSREISARVRYNPATGRYSGTYVGARAGPATITGKRSGDRVNFTMTWPKPVNGSTRARMTLVNDGGLLRIQVVSQPKPDGPATTLSDLTFRKN